MGTAGKRRTPATGRTAQLEDDAPSARPFRWLLVGLVTGSAVFGWWLATRATSGASEPASAASGSLGGRNGVAGDDSYRLVHASWGDVGSRPPPPKPDRPLNEREQRWAEFEKTAPDRWKGLELFVRKP
jgi:hypothetical protein